MMRMPAIIVGDHGDGDVAELRLAREFRFLQIGHADDIHAEATVNIRFCLGRELRAFHAEIGAAMLRDNTHLLTGRFDHLCQLCANGIGESNMGDDAATKKSIHAMTGAVEELIGYHELEWLVLFLERSDGRNGDDPLDAELLESVNVGAEIELARHNSVAASVP